MANTLNLGDGNWATKEDLLLGYNSENNNYKPLPFDFSRGSSATVINKDGLIETVGSGEPRVDYKDNTKGALLLEPSRSNLVTYSEDFNNASWLKTNLTLASNDLISPDGSYNASKITLTGNSQIMQTTLSLSVGTTYTISCFVKKGTQRWVRLAYASSSSNGAWFDLDNNVTGTVNSTSATIENYGNGWYKITNTLSSQIASGGVFIGFSGLDGSTSGATIGNTCNIWGFQLEQGSYATSYIPTVGSAVTRIAEVCNNGGNEQVFNDSEGVLMAEISALVSGGSTRVISLSGGIQSVNNIYINFNSSGGVSCQVLTSGGNVNLSTTNVNQVDNNKIAIKYKANDFALWLNGVEVDTDTSLSSTPIGLDRLNFDFGAGSYDLYGNVKDIRVYNTALSDQELEALTTI
jgi:hypothetical protein